MPTGKNFCQDGGDGGDEGDEHKLACLGRVGQRGLSPQPYNLATISARIQAAMPVNLHAPDPASLLHKFDTSCT